MKLRLSFMLFTVHVVAIILFSLLCVLVILWNTINKHWMKYCETQSIVTWSEVFLFLSPVPSIYQNSAVCNLVVSHEVDINWANMLWEIRCVAINARSLQRIS